MLGQVIEGYKLEKELGEGAFGKVFKASKDGKYYAIKSLSEEDSTGAIEENIANNCKFQCPFLVKYFCSFRVSKKLFIVEELCEQGDLLGLLKKGKLDDQRIMKIMIQTLLGVQELHHNDMIHRDLKPQNILLNAAGDVKVADFGIVKKLSGPQDYTKSPIGTLFYMSPEALRGENYNFLADVWSLGVICYRLCTQTLPFYDENTFALIQKIIVGKFPPIPKSAVADEIINLTNLMLTVDFHKRPTVLSLLKQPVVQTFGASLSLIQYFPIAAKGGGKTFIWRDIHGKTAENVEYWKTLCHKYGEKVELVTVTDDNAALAIVDSIRDKSTVFVATNRLGGGAEFLQKCRLRGVQTPAVVFCKHVETWKPMPNVEIGVSSDTLETFLKKYVL